MNNQENIRLNCECLSESPYSNEAKDIIKASRKVKNVTSFDLLKVIVVFNLAFFYRNLEKTLPPNPINLFKKILKKNEALLNLGYETLPNINFPTPRSFEKTQDDITAEHYGNLFSEFQNDNYFNETKKNFSQRLERNGFDFNWLKNKKVLDAGCGNGRYSYAIKCLGAGEVFGLDFSKINLGDAKKRLKEYPIDNLSYTEGSVLDIPFKDEEFDFVISNGVLHHTTNENLGIKEMLRVMKKDGQGFLMLINSPGGIHWDFVEICREILFDVPFNFVHDVFSMLNMPKNLQYLYLDHILVPINTRLTKNEIIDKLDTSPMVQI